MVSSCLVPDLLSSSLRPSEKSHSERVVIKANGVKYISDRVVGNGSFGVVFQATCVSTDEVVAIKKVLQDKRFKVRERVSSRRPRLYNHLLGPVFYSSPSPS